MTPRSVIDLLRDQPEETLLAMRSAIQEELARLQVELGQVDTALARRPRRSARPVKATVYGGSNGRRAVLTRQMLFEFVKELGRPVSPPEVMRAYAERGVTVSSNSVRNSLARLVEIDGLLVRIEDGRYTPADQAAAANRTEANDPLSGDVEPQSHDSEARLGI